MMLLVTILFLLCKKLARRQSNVPFHIHSIWKPSFQTPFLLPQQLSLKWQTFQKDSSALNATGHKVCQLRRLSDLSQWCMLLISRLLLGLFLQQWKLQGLPHYTNQKLPVIFGILFTGLHKRVLIDNNISIWTET